MPTISSIHLARNCSTALRSRAAISSYTRELSGVGGVRCISHSRSSIDTSQYASSATSLQVGISSGRVLKSRVSSARNTGREFSSISSSLNHNHSSKSRVANDVNGKNVPKSNPRSFNMNLASDLLETVNKGSTSITVQELYDLASQPCTPLSLSDMYKYAGQNALSNNYAAQRLRNAQFLHKELPIRVAQRAVDLLTLPHGLNKTSQVQTIAHAYLSYLTKILDFPCPKNEAEEYEFTEALKDIVKDRKTIPMAIANGVASLKDNRREDLDMRRLQEMEKALYRFFNARTGLRLLAEHHILGCVQRKNENVEFRKQQSCIDSIPLEQERDNFIGCINDNCDPYTEVQQVVDQVAKHCRECYGIAPEIEVLDCTLDRYSDSKFTYVPHHLQYCLAELLKNSCRATIRKHLQDEGNSSISEHSLPSVRVVIAKGAEDVTIKIADKGGGVPRSVMDKMWTFAHTTSHEIQSKEIDTSFETDEFSGSKIRGFGLPMARIYARYFGGELTLKSMEGYGVDAYLYLPVLGDACENLPKRVRKSPANNDSVHDGNHHAYAGDVFSSSFLSGEEPWAGSNRHFSTSTLSFDRLDRIAI